MVLDWKGGTHRMLSARVVLDRAGRDWVCMWHGSGSRGSGGAGENELRVGGRGPLRLIQCVHRAFRNGFVRIPRRFAPSWTKTAGIPPLECSVRSDELPVSMRIGGAWLRWSAAGMLCTLWRAAGVHAHAYARGRVRVCVCVCACVGLHESHHSVISTRDHHRSSGDLVIKG